MPQEELGNLLGIKKAAYGKKENGISPFTMEELEKVCKKLGLDFKDISSSLPMQTKTAPVSSDEYVKLTNQLIAAQNEAAELRTSLSNLTLENASLKNEIAGSSFRKSANIFTFFEDQVQKMQDLYGKEYKVDWTEVAKAAKLEDAEKFLFRYGEYRANETSEFLQQSESPQDRVLRAAKIVQAEARASGVSSFELLKHALQQQQATDQSSHPETNSTQKKA